jgi:hypothetical protein
LLGLNGVRRKLASLKHASPLIRLDLRDSPTHHGMKSKQGIALVAPNQSWRSVHVNALPGLAA